MQAYYFLGFLSIDKPNDLFAAFKKQKLSKMVYISTKRIFSNSNQDEKKQMRYLSAFNHFCFRTQL